MPLAKKSSSLPQPPQTVDPLEAAKQPATSARSSTTTPSAGEPMADDATPQQQQAQPQQPAQKYRIKANRVVSLHGMIYELKEGQIVSTDGYVQATLDAMRAAGAILEPVPA